MSCLVNSFYSPARVVSGHTGWPPHPDTPPQSFPLVPGQDPGHLLRPSPNQNEMALARSAGYWGLSLGEYVQFWDPGQEKASVPLETYNLRGWPSLEENIKA